MPEYSLGRLVEHDPRSRTFRAATIAVKPRTVMWAHQAPVLDQGDIGQCTGAAMAQWLNTDYGGGRRLDIGDATDLYRLATRLDGFPGVYPPDDTGSSGLAVCKAARKLGYITAYRWTFSFQSFLSALSRSPLLVGTIWTESMFTPDRDLFIKPAGDPVGGHEYLMVGVNVEGQYVTLLNSWGESWGYRGRARITFADMALLLAQQGDVKIPIR